MSRRNRSLTHVLLLYRREVGFHYKLRHQVPHGPRGCRGKRRLTTKLKYIEKDTDLCQM